MIYLKAFIAGFVSTLVFHQGVLWLLYAVGFSPRAPWNMTPVPPLNIPAVISLAFWGGLWGILLWALIGASSGESGRVVRSNADEGHGPRRRLGPENHRKRTAAEWRLGTRHRAADPATDPSQCFIREMTMKTNHMASLGHCRKCGDTKRQTIFENQKMKGTQ